MDEQSSAQVTDELRWLARGPSDMARRFSGYVINGFRFHTKKRERLLKTQNSGVVVKTKISSNEINYYGQLTDIIQLDYSGRYKAVLFKCDWVDINRGCKKDKFGRTLVNFKFLKHTGKDICDDPYVFASQAKKVFYVWDERNKDWPVVENVKVRDTYDMGDEDHNDIEAMSEQTTHDIDEATQNENDWLRREVNDDDEVLEVEANAIAIHDDSNSDDDVNQEDCI